MRHRRGAVIVLLLTGLGVAGWGSRQLRVPDGERLLVDARRALNAGRFDDAERLALSAVQSPGSSAAGWLLAGAAAYKADRPAEALGHLRHIIDGNSDESVQAAYLAGDVALRMGLASEAERQFSRVVELRPDMAAARRKLTAVLTIEGRRWEAQPHFHALLRQDQAQLDDLILLGHVWSDFEMPSLVDEMLRQAPDDPLPLLAKARIELRKNHCKEAAELLHTVLRTCPGQLEAHAWLGVALVQGGRLDEAALWNESLPQEANTHPLVWVVRGLWAQEHGQVRAAIRCFWEAARIDPNQLVAHYHLATLLEAESNHVPATRFRERAEQLLALEQALASLHHSRKNVDAMRDAARLTESLGRPWEARKWHMAVWNLDPFDQAAHRDAARLHAIASASEAWVLPSACPALHIDFRSYPLPFWKRADNTTASPLSGSTTRFFDAAATAGIDFQYLAADDPHTEGRRIIEALGGGAAAFDYDGDAWVDLYLTQGGEWPPNSSNEAAVDRLFRNRGGGAFDDVSSAAGISDAAFSHGVASGDFDVDGFPDLYVANNGVNALYHNNGDGTFQELAAAAGLQSDRWTASCLMADLNGDRLPDLYDVNYCAGDMEKICAVRGDRMRNCHPRGFPAADDVVWRNRGDGTFEDCSASAGIIVPDGRGMGIVAADFDGSGRLSLFVANDQTANFFFRNTTAQSGDDPTFAETAVVSGLAFDKEGRGQACMGVAAGDANGDGLLDLFVTNFYAESNTLYSQDTSRKFFVDNTISAGLRDPSFAMLGFGTQFIDGDLDGLLDLIVTNGHVDDFTYENIPFTMPPQYFRNVGGGRYVELPARELGPFFSGLYRGRGLARLDWNRDLRDDVVISHIDSPVALLTNQSTGFGHSFVLQLRGVESNRDAIGTIVSIEAGGRRQSTQLTAGDGYQASNQRQLLFGLGAAESVDKLVVRWPSGKEQSFSGLPTDIELVLVEGMPLPVQLPSSPGRQQDAPGRN